MKEYTAEQIASWFLTKQKIAEKLDDGIDPMTQMKLHKLLYYAQGVALAVLGKKLFNEDLLAWEHGPVVRSIYDKYKGHRAIDAPLKDEQIKDFKNIEHNDKLANNILEEVYKIYGGYSASQLRNMTHNEAPWKDTSPNDVIEPEKIKEYFRENIIEDE